MLPEGTTGWLTARSADLYRPGDKAHAWLVERNDLRPAAPFPDYDFGRLPIVPRQRLRYLMACNEVGRVLRGEISPREIALEHLSEFKGLLNLLAVAGGHDKVGGGRGVEGRGMPLLSRWRRTIGRR